MDSLLKGDWEDRDKTTPYLHSGGVCQMWQTSENVRVIFKTSIFIGFQVLLLEIGSVRFWTAYSIRAVLPSTLKLRINSFLFKWCISHPSVHCFWRKFENKARIKVKIRVCVVLLILWGKRGRSEQNSCLRWEPVEQFLTSEAGLLCELLSMW